MGRRGRAKRKIAEAAAKGGAEDAGQAPAASSGSAPGAEPITRSLQIHENLVALSAGTSVRVLDLRCVLF